MMRHKHMRLIATEAGYDVHAWCNGTPAQGWTYSRTYRNVSVSTVSRFYARSMGYRVM